MPAGRKRLGDLLVDNRLITRDQLDQALAMQQERPDPLSQILVRTGAIKENLLLQAMAAQIGVAPWRLEEDQPSPEALSKVPGEICRKYQVLPLRVRSDLLLLAMRNPEDLDAIDIVRNLTKMRIEPVLADESRLASAIDSCYSADGAPVKAAVDALVVKAMKDVDGKVADAQRTQRAVLTEEETRPVVGLVNQIVSDAIRSQASDIHLEPFFDHLEVRYRLDGQLVKVREIPQALIPMLTTRIKIMADLDIVEYRLPQDGRITAQIDKRTVDLRVNVIPNYHGQRIVLRILDRASSLRKLDELGFAPTNLALFRAMVEKPYGMVLVTGPTGSGKTTTLYGALSELKNVANNIMTCEDPVEYEIPGISQSQVNEKVGLSFAALLRAALRQDPDIILVGEIRDRETAETAIRASLTGHLVLSTLHTNDAPSAIPRLLDMGVDPYLLSTCLVGVTAQRLVRRLCPHCRVEDADPQVRSFIGDALGSDNAPMVFTSKGCNRCMKTGFKGRMAVHEVMPVSGGVVSAIASHSPVDAIRQAGAEYGYQPLQVDAMRRVLDGSTSMEEVRRVVFFETWKRLAEGQASPALRLAS